ncbi:polysaccharide deacetylase family protein [Brevibacillus sp. NRS-1366]|uniref:polysaccharide deacetylase family protein n=1 Tax=Brevibacillus sp. NRS-1366 TaxID=3233899 RepID=UPI003D263998
MIALTFDDGPNPLYTPQTLDLLKQYKAKSIFFVNGNQVSKYPKLARRQVQEGHKGEGGAVLKVVALQISKSVIICSGLQQF